LRPPASERRLEAFNRRWLGHLRAVIVPDTREDRLSGDLGHRLEVFPPERVVYAGILSRLRAQPRPVPPRDVDLFVTLSGPEPQRSMLERVVIRQLPSLGIRAIVTLGTPDVRTHRRIGDADVYGFLDRAAQEEMMNRARIVVCRAGYSTIMDLAEVRRRAVLIPTPGYTEQVYLARYHHARGTALAVNQGRLDLSAAAAQGSRLPPLYASVTTDDAVRTITALIRAG
jgi:UDP-N-acetylglucosamine transferase subunit ALG13